MPGLFFAKAVLD